MTNIVTARWNNVFFSEARQRHAFAAGFGSGGGRATMYGWRRMSGHSISQAPATTSHPLRPGAGQDTLNLTGFTGRETSEPTPSLLGMTFEPEDLRFRRGRQIGRVVEPVGHPGLAERRRRHPVRWTAKPSASSRFADGTVLDAARSRPGFTDLAGGSRVGTRETTTLAGSKGDSVSSVTKADTFPATDGAR